VQKPCWLALGPLFARSYGFRTDRHSFRQVSSLFLHLRDRDLDVLKTRLAVQRIRIQLLKQ